MPALSWARVLRRHGPAAGSDAGGLDQFNDLVASQPAEPYAAEPETGHGGDMARRWLAQVRAGVHNHIPVSIAAAILLAAGAATLFAPLPGSSSPTGLAALTAAPFPKPSDTAPSPDQSVVDADNTAVATAQSGSDTAQAAVSTAQAAETAAAALQTKATDAQSAADGASNSGTSYTVTADQSTVDMDNQAVQSAQSQLQSAQDMLATDQQQQLDTTYDNQAIASAQAAISSAQTTLATDTATLTTDQNTSNSAAATAQSQQAIADGLAKQATAAQATADAQLSTAQASADTAATALSDAQATQTQHQQSDVVAASAWYHQHSLALFAVNAKNTTMADYRKAAIKNVAVGGALAASSVILITFDVLRRRRGYYGESAG